MCEPFSVVRLWGQFSRGHVGTHENILLMGEGALRPDTEVLLHGRMLAATGERNFRNLSYTSGYESCFCFCLTRKESSCVGVGSGCPRAGPRSPSPALRQALFPWPWSVHCWGTRPQLRNEAERGRNQLTRSSPWALWFRGSPEEGETSLLVRRPPSPRPQPASLGPRGPGRVLRAPPQREEVPALPLGPATAGRGCRVGDSSVPAWRPHPGHRWVPPQTRLSPPRVSPAGCPV